MNLLVKPCLIKDLFSGDDSSKKEQYFLFRFGIIHCVADSGVYGMLVKKPEGVEWKNDDWIQIEEKFQLNFISRFMRIFQC